MRTVNDVFLSYASADRDVARAFADAFEALGWSVWWDREIPHGKAFDQVIEAELTSARCVVVLWSSESVRSRWVKTEAGAAADRDRLVPVLIEALAIPLEFRRIQTAMLPGWHGDREHPEFLRLVASIRVMIGAPQLHAQPTHAAAPRSTTRRTHWQKKAAIGAAALVLLAIAIIVALSPIETKAPVAASSSAPPASARSAPDPNAAAPAAANAAPAVSVKGAFPIRIGDRIEDGVPAAGAGNIETPGAKDSYAFSAAAGQQVYFRVLDYGRGMEHIEWRVSGPDGAEILESRLGYRDPGVHVLKKPGVYTMRLGSDREPATGTYRLQLFNVPPPQQFTIKVGDVIREGQPGPGAGEIESPGAKDVYTFSAAAGQRVYFRMLEHARGMEQIHWTLSDSDGAAVFESRLGFRDPGVHVLRKGGAYTMSVGADREPATGTYRLQLTGVAGD